MNINILKLRRMWEGNHICAATYYYALIQSDDYIRLRLRLRYCKNLMGAYDSVLLPHPWNIGVTNHAND